MYYQTLAKLAELKMKFEDDIRGVTAVEYAIIAVVMSALVLAAFQTDTLKDAITGALGKVTSNLKGATATPTK
ncbi:Flp family type IVb pilin [Vibrio pomeroyi]|uniref:Flp family type IVb pilin n=1 Tax=Vibrio pomeroyi TaxID=198832 RepID=UPI0021C4BDCC|nr:Flp family type IVb pilin [Vibrio pomeroyi]